MSANAPLTTQELLKQAGEAIGAGDPARALALFAGSGATPRHPEVFFQQAIAHRMLNNPNAAIEALDAAIAIEPYHLPSILSKGVILEDGGRRTEAAAIYRNALTIAPNGERLPPSLKIAHDRARALVAVESERLKSAFDNALSAARAKFAPSDIKRFDECADIYSGVARPRYSTPSMLYFPGLPQVSFFDRALFPWFEELEAATRDIKDELVAVLASPEADAFAPYIAYPPGAPVNQWGELNHSARWSTYFFFKDGAKQAAACARAPKTAALLERLPGIAIDGVAPTSMFSSLAARTRIPPHTGSTNARAIVHLPLILPGPAWFRVGNERREWRMGEAWAFDDTVEHEAMNESDKTRVILILDVWNPYISEPERELIGLMIDAKRGYLARDGLVAEQFS